MGLHNYAVCVLWIKMQILQLVYDMFNIMYSDFHGNILKDIEYITKSLLRGLVRSFLSLYFNVKNILYNVVIYASHTL